MRRFTVSHQYDPALDPSTWRDCRNPFLNHSDDPLKQLFVASKISAGRRRGGATRKAQAAHNREARQEAETHAVATLQSVVTALEMALQELNDIPCPTMTYKSRVNQQQMHNALVLLKTKCGLAFEPSEFTHTVRLDRLHLKD